MFHLAARRQAEPLLRAFMCLLLGHGNIRGDCPNFAESSEQNGTVPFSPRPAKSRSHFMGIHQCIAFAASRKGCCHGISECKTAHLPPIPRPPPQRRFRCWATPAGGRIMHTPRHSM
jgi:hypothetical protein